MTMTHALQTHKRKHQPKRKKRMLIPLKENHIEKKTTLFYLRNQDWRTVKSEIEKANDLLTNIQTNDITELNYLIYFGVKLV